MEKEPSSLTLTPFFIRNLLACIFVYASKSIASLAGKAKLLQVVSYLIVFSFGFLLRLLRSFQTKPDSITMVEEFHRAPGSRRKGATAAPPSGLATDSAIGRALSQLLWSLHEIPVSSRKYEMIRSLAEKLIKENHDEKAAALNEVNHRSLSAALSRTLGFLERVMEASPCDPDALPSESGFGYGPLKHRLIRVLDAAIERRRMTPLEGGAAAERLAGEAFWITQRLAECGFGEEAVRRWASSSKVAWLALTTAPRLQCSLVKVSAFLFKEAKYIWEEEMDEGRKAALRKTMKTMLVSWLPLLCRASNGADVPVLSSGERAEVERVLQWTVENLETEEDEEDVLRLWLYHFTFSPSSDWPNLHPSFSRWCTASRRKIALK